MCVVVSEQGIISVCAWPPRDIAHHLLCLLRVFSRARTTLHVLQMQEVMGDECMRDVRKLKRAVKAFCGGKKKGTAA